jgi:hypothetical protein
VGGPRRVCLGQLLKDEEREKLARSSKDWLLFVHKHPPQNCPTLKEENRYEGFDLIDL